jgi:hypothetical protein
MTSVAQKTLPQVNGDFYQIGSTFSEEDQALLKRVRSFMETEVVPNYQSVLDTRGISASAGLRVGSPGHRWYAVSRVWVPRQG